MHYAHRMQKYCHVGIQSGISCLQTRMGLLYSSKKLISLSGETCFTWNLLFASMLEVEKMSKEYSKKLQNDFLARDRLFFPSRSEKKTSYLMWIRALYRVFHNNTERYNFSAKIL